MTFTQNLEALGSSTSDVTFEGTLAGVRAFGDNRLRLQVSGGTLLDGEGSIQDNFTVGGFLFLSGYPEFELTGEHFAFSGIIGYRDIGVRSVFFDMPVVIGGSLETARLWNDGEGDISQRYSGSLFAGFDTPIGPVFLGYGTGGLDRHIVYFSLGQEF